MNTKRWKKMLPEGILIGGGVLLLGVGLMSVVKGECPFSSCGKSFSVAKKEAPVKSESVDWSTDFEASKARAAKEKKILLLSFSGSDWCGWCRKLDREVMASPEFAAWVKKNAVAVKIDFPRNLPQTDALKLQNQTLAQYYRVEGFPTVILAGVDGREIARTGYKAGGAAAYVKHLDSIRK